MFKRIRHLEISLATKCQLLFGAAVLLIITAALLVPWRRIEQLMAEMNERTAETLAHWAEADHIARAVQSQRPDGRPATQPAMPTTAPAISGGRDRPVVKLIMIGEDPMNLSRFEEKALEHFKKEPKADPYSRTHEYKEGPTAFRYARALYATEQCLKCHAWDVHRGGLNEMGEVDDEEVRAAAARAVIGADPTDESEQAPLLGLVSIEIPYQYDVSQAYLNRIVMFLAGLLAGTLAIIVFYLITTRLILKPVRVLRETAEKVSSGNLNIRAHVSTGDEFQQLSEAFNKMLANLQESEDQLRSINKSLDMKLVQMAESNLALYESNRLKSEFLANVSHELRTPLNSILGFAELLKDSTFASDPKNVRYITNITNSGKHLLELINNLLDLAKIEAGKMEVRSEPLSLTDLCEGLVSIIKPLAEKKDVSVVTSIARDVPIVQTDPAKLQQVLFNFLSNAIKFSPEHGRIDLKVERAGEDHVRVMVSDQGVGIEPDKQAMIFEKFRQIDASVTRKHEGTGLGLAISKELTLLLGGSIGVQSTPGEGATFWVVLPVKIAGGTAAVQMEVANQEG
jgi:signal transduction histidine kinase